MTRLRSAEYQPKAIVSDGNSSLLRAVNLVFPEAQQQRCLLHLQWQCLVWLTQQPKTLAGQSLRRIALDLLKVESMQEAQVWNLSFDTWVECFKMFCRRKPLLLLHSLPLRSLSPTLLEGRINAPIKRLLHRHSGLRLDRQRIAIAWWISFRNNP